MVMTATHIVDEVPIEMVFDLYHNHKGIMLNISDRRIQEAILDGGGRLIKALEWGIANCAELEAALTIGQLRQCHNGSDVFLLYDDDDLRKLRENPFLCSSDLHTVDLELQRREEKAERIANGRDVPPDLRKQIMLRDKEHCRYCGNEAECIDHILPHSRGGKTVEQNLVAACKPCNSKKYNRTPEEAGMTT